MNFQKSKWTSRAVCLITAVLFFTFFAIGLRSFARQILVKNLGISSPAINLLFCDDPTLSTVEKKGKTFGDVLMDIDWEAQYPFAPDTEIEKHIQAAQPVQVSPLTKLENRIFSFEHSACNFLRVMIPFYTDIVATTSRLENAIGWNIPRYSEYNPVMRLEDNYFITVEAEQNQAEAIWAINELNEFCSEQGSSFLFVVPPSKIDSEKDRMYSGTIDFSNQNKDAFISELENLQIDYIDLREYMRNENLDTHDLFFETDHHWKPETGLWATQKIAEHLNKTIGSNIDITLFDQSSYDKEILDDCFLGSQGKKVTAAVASPEDISILHPLFETNLNFKVPSMGIDQIGDFSITYDPDPINAKDPMTNDAYAAYAYCNKAVVQYENMVNRDPLRILVIKDSFANVVTPFLAQGVAQLDALDLRIFTGSTKAYIKEMKPDIVMVLYSNGLSGEINWNSHTSKFDFR